MPHLNHADVALDADGGVDVNDPDWQDPDEEDAQPPDPDEDLRTALGGDDREAAQDAFDRLPAAYKDHLTKAILHHAGLGLHPGEFER